ncbi:hypothetical protein D9619_008206 [Psilocybe cf. subviscida]|uniref:Transcriptional repressor Tup1 N-terminal domain-containing protein n=1 Tax=Psilocybe cf. subviscida TaxID=2480587 RepID=A0A8H5ATP3_9AGAR|nr:hypothetical protein D9619_008206 [Psilocybe cf. subviscida]
MADDLHISSLPSSLPPTEPSVVAPDTHHRKHSQPPTSIPAAPNAQPFSPFNLPFPPHPQPNPALSASERTALSTPYNQSDLSSAIPPNPLTNLRTFGQPRTSTRASPMNSANASPSIPLLSLSGPGMPHDVKHGNAPSPHLPMNVPSARRDRAFTSNDGMNATHGHPRRPGSASYATSRRHTVTTAATNNMGSPLSQPATGMTPTPISSLRALASAVSYIEPSTSMSMTRQYPMSRLAADDDDVATNNVPRRAQRAREYTKTTNPDVSMNIDYPPPVVAIPLRPHHATPTTPMAMPSPVHLHPPSLFYGQHDDVIRNVNQNHLRRPSTSQQQHRTLQPTSGPPNPSVGGVGVPPTAQLPPHPSAAPLDRGERDLRGERDPRGIDVRDVRGVDRDREMRIDTRDRDPRDRGVDPRDARDMRGGDPRDMRGGGDPRDVVVVGRGGDPRDLRERERVGERDRIIDREREAVAVAAAQAQQERERILHQQQVASARERGGRHPVVSMGEATPVDPRGPGADPRELGVRERGDSLSMMREGRPGGSSATGSISIGGPGGPVGAGLPPQPMVVTGVPVNGVGSAVAERGDIAMRDGTRPVRLRLDDSLDAIRQEFEGMSQELAAMRAQRDEYEAKCTFLQ